MFNSLAGPCLHLSHVGSKSGLILDSVTFDQWSQSTIVNWQMDKCHWQMDNEKMLWIIFCQIASGICSFFSHLTDWLISWYLYFKHVKEKKRNEQQKIHNLQYMCEKEQEEVNLKAKVLYLSIYLYYYYNLKLSNYVDWEGYTSYESVCRDIKGSNQSVRLHNCRYL